MPRLCALLIGLLLLPGVVRGQDFKIKPSPLLHNERVQRELKLTDAQKAAIAELQGEHRTETRAADKAGDERRAEVREAAGGEAFEKLPPEARAEIQAASREANRARAELATRQDRELRKLLTPEQAKRLLGIFLQRLGVIAFESDELIKALNIDADKRAEINAILAANDAALQPHWEKYAQAYNALMKPYQTPSGATMLDEYRKAVAADPALGRKLREILDARETARTRLSDASRLKILKTLTKRQQESYRKMLGEPFDWGPPPGAAEPAPKPAVEPSAPLSKPLSERRGVPK